MDESGSRTRRRTVIFAAGALVLAALAIAGFLRLGDWRMRQALAREYPDQVQAHPELVRYGASLGETAYREHCAACHGAELEGDPAKGAPNLADSVWLYELGEVSDIERTIMYGIRSGHSKSRNITAMPALGVLKQLTPAEVDDVVTYTLSLSSKQGEPGALARGKVIFEDKGVCYDCHNRDGSGNPDYGAPDLTDAEWTFGGDPASVRRSVYDGRRGRCPAWIGTLDFPTIRALAVYLYEKSHADPG